MRTKSESHKFYLEFNVEGELVECLTDIEMSDTDMGIDRNIDRMQCPLKVIMLAEKVYNLTERMIIKDRTTGMTGPVLTPKDVFELTLSPHIPLKEIKMMMGLK